MQRVLSLFEVPLLRDHKSHHATGAVLIESAISITLFAIIVLGFAHLYSVSLDRIRHVQVVTEMLMGPQERSLWFDPTEPGAVPGAFKVIDNSSQPTLDQFMDQLGNFFVSRNLSNAVLHMRLVHVSINNETGISSANAIAVGSDDQVFTYPSGATGPCNTNEIRNALINYSASQGGAVASYVDPGTGSKPAIGTKLYDVSTRPNRYKGYVDFIPLVYLTICSEPYNFLFPQLAISNYEFVPRRLVN